MPLKHTLETFLVFLLATVLILTGLLIATLPPLPDGVVPWGFLFVLTILYPLILLPLFKRRRADYTFRILHWFPFLMLVVWFGLQLGARHIPSLESARQFFERGWTFSGVFLGFFFLAAFCLRVLRRRGERLVLLLLAFIPFTVGSYWSTQGVAAEQAVGSLLWDHDFWRSESISALFPETQKEQEERLLARSEDPHEERWRERLRAIERRRERIASRISTQQGSVRSEVSDVGSSVSSITSSAVSSYSVSSGGATEPEIPFVKPNHLPSSGLGIEFIILSLVAGYCGTLHKRSRDRV